MPLLAIKLTHSYIKSCDLGRDVPTRTDRQYTFPVLKRDLKLYTKIKLNALEMCLGKDTGKYFDQESFQVIAYLKKRKT